MINAKTMGGTSFPAWLLRLLMAMTLIAALASCGDDSDEVASDDSSAEEMADGGDMDDMPGMPDEMGAGDDDMSMAARQDEDFFTDSFDDDVSDSDQARRPTMKVPSVPTSRAVDYVTIDRKTENKNGRTTVKLWITAPDARNRDALGQTALKAASEVARQVNAQRVEAHVIPTEERAFVDTRYTRAFAFIEGGQWEARVSRSNPSEDDLVFLEIYVKSLPRFRDGRGRLRERELNTYIARVMGARPREVSRSVRRARRALERKSSYRPS